MSTTIGVASGLRLRERMAELSLLPAEYCDAGFHRWPRLEARCTTGW